MNAFPRILDAITYAIAICAASAALLAFLLGVKQLVEILIDRLCGRGEIDDDKDDDLMAVAAAIADDKSHDFWGHVTQAMQKEGEIGDPPDNSHLD